MKGVIFLLAVVLWRVTRADIVSPRQCSDGTTNQISNMTIDISNCDNPHNCTLVKGQTYYLTTTFIPTTETCILKFGIWGLIGRMRVPYVRAKNICEEVSSSDGEKCTPCGGVKTDTEYKHVASFHVGRLYPQISLTVRVMYFANKHKKILCFEIPVHIVARSHT